MARRPSGHVYRLLCRCGDCTWSMSVVVPHGHEPRDELLLVLRAHADSFRHGRRIEGVAIGVNGDVAILILRHP